MTFSSLIRYDWVRCACAPSAAAVVVNKRRALAGGQAFRRLVAGNITPRDESAARWPNLRTEDGLNGKYL